MSRSQRTKKILIVEDEASLQKVMLRQISGLGHVVLTASDGEQALEMIEAYNLDLILLDIILPIKNGFEVLRELRLKHKQRTPVIVISNLESKQDKESAKKLGVSDYVTKSDITLRDLTRLVSQVLEEADEVV